jgi:hypothetical protein
MSGVERITIAEAQVANAPVESILVAAMLLAMSRHAKCPDSRTLSVMSVVGVLNAPVFAAMPMQPAAALGGCFLASW